MGKPQLLGGKLRLCDLQVRRAAAQQLLVRAGAHYVAVADQIIVLDDGRMVGLGRHADLLKTCPVYEEIYASQFKKGDAQK